MMTVVLNKMPVLEGEPSQYFLKNGEGNLAVNSWIGKKLSLTFKDKIFCSVCGNLTKKVFGQGFCYPCFLKAPENSECIIRPELCQGHLGKGRDAEWEAKNHVQPHIVYLALTSAVKVGVTRKSNLQNRWLDQGAWKATALAGVPNRYLAGLIEVAIKDQISDKTNWRKMLTNQNDLEIDLIAEKSRLKAFVPAELQQYIVHSNEVTELYYPVERYPDKVSSKNFDKEQTIEGVLTGVKGQYLIFEGGNVLNIRKFTGYEVEISLDEASMPANPQMTLF